MVNRLVTYTFPALLCLSSSVASFAQSQSPDISTIPPDLVIPAVRAGDPSPGQRVFYRLPGDPESVPAMVLYLPVDWSPKRRFPVLCEYAGNGNYQNAFGDASTGRPEGSRLGYGLSGGNGFIWVCLPFLNEGGDKLAVTWWGDAPGHRPDATAAYAKRAIPAICAAFAGDRERVILCGFSRGAIACNAIGLHDDEIAKLWSGFFCYSHYDGVGEKWPFAGSDREAAMKRLERLNGRSQFICQENAPGAALNLTATRTYLRESGMTGDFTFIETGFRNHSDAWLLRPSPARDAARAWLKTITAD